MNELETRQLREARDRDAGLALRRAVVLGLVAVLTAAYGFRATDPGQQQLGFAIAIVLTVVVVWQLWSERQRNADMHE